MRTTITLLVAIVLLASCNQYQSTPTGVKYKITSGGSKETLKQGQFVKYNVEYKTGKDSILQTSYGHIPTYMIVDTAKITKHSFFELLSKLAPGDKVEFVLSVDSLKKLGFIEYNNIFKAKDLIKGRAEIIKTFPGQPDVMADVQKEQDAEKAKEIKELQDFTAKKGIKTQSTASGVLVEITNAGDAQKADSGKQVQVLYKGTFLDGKVFDSNMDKNKPNNQPLSVIIGAQGVIKGMDDALRLFGKGGKGRMFIPAMLGYGPYPNPPIPAYTNLIFEVEVLDVATPAPQPAAAPGAPGANPHK